MSRAARDVLYFVAPGRVEVRRELLPMVQRGQAQVRVCASAISAGTELLAYRGQMSATMTRDVNLGALSGTFDYPFSYGYACVGVIEALLPGQEACDPRLEIGRRVFAFQPHASRFVTATAELVPLPDGLSDEAALFLPNMETAVTIVLDAAPLLGERVAVWGLGTVGRLVVFLLRDFPLHCLLAFDARADRQAWVHTLKGVQAQWPDDHAKVDLAIEASGSPFALQSAIERCDLEGRVVVGSWYGDKAVTLNLGDAFHRRRLRLISSQVSTLPGTLSRAWTSSRRWQVALRALQNLDPRAWISHRFSLEQAEKAYALLDRGVPGCEQVVFTYP